MPYAPTVEDNSGLILGQGIAGGLNAIVQGMQQAAAERRRKEEEKQLQTTLGPVIEQLSGGRIKLEDAPKEAWPMLYQAAQQEMQRPMIELQRRNAELENVLRSLQVQRAPGMAASEDEAAGLNNELLRLQVEAAKAPAPADRTGSVIDIAGQPFYFQNAGQVAPVPHPGGGGGAASPLGKVLEDMGAARGRGDTEAAGLLQQGAQTMAAGTGRAKELDPVTVLQWRGLEQQRAQLMQEIARHQQAIGAGDRRTGFLNMGSRQGAVEELTRKLAELELQQQILLSRPGGGSDQAPTAAGAPATAAGGAPAGGVIDRDSFFQGL